MRDHPPIGNGWGIINGKCRPLRSSLPALPMNLSCESASITENSENEYSDSESSSSTDSEHDE